MNRKMNFPDGVGQTLMWVLAVCLLLPGLAEAKKNIPAKLIFVPHDSRPISSDMSAAVVRELGYEVIMPPAELLGNRDYLGEPDKIWAWLDEAARRDKTIKGAVLSGDTLLYGSLVASRKHVLPQATIDERVARFQRFHAEHAKLPLYVFASIMRTPRNGDASGSQEPKYYQNYGADIFRYTALVDKSETKGLTNREQKEFNFLKRLIPKDALADWLSRRNKNMAASKGLIDLARQNVFAYLTLGRDDNAPYSQTHMESRHLESYGQDLGVAKFQAMAGIDEFAELMLARAVNHIKKEVPFVYVKYNWGRGPKTVPAYSDETIEESIRDHIVAVGAMPVQSADNAEMILLVNTHPNGKTLEANDVGNTVTPRPDTKYFVDLVGDELVRGRSVAVADITFANGSDNALLEMMKNRGYLFKLTAYSGWNTATNSAGFALAQGIMANGLDGDAKDRLLLMRYLDEWAYQANVRTVIGRQLGWFRRTGAYSDLAEQREAVEERTTDRMRQFANRNLPPFPQLSKLRVTFPWNRMFECRIDFREPARLRSLLKDVAEE